MKKILIVSLEYPPTIGGIATYVHQLALALPNKELAVLAPKIKEAKEWDSAQTYPIIRARLLFPKYIWPRWLLLCWTLWRVVKKYGFDMVYIHHVLPVGYATWLLKKITRVPFIIFSHGTDIIAASNSKWKSKWVRFIMREAEQIITNSDSLERRLTELLPEAETKTTKMYPCPDKEFFLRPSAKIIDIVQNQLALEGKTVILSVARLAEGKGFPHMIRLLPALLERIPNIVWVIVGDGPKKDSILKEIQKSHLQNVVRYIGEVKHEQLSMYYYLANVFMLLTHPDQGFEEGLGLVFLEAAAAGLPIVAGRSGGVEEAVIHGKTGLIVDTYQDISVLSALTEILTNKEFAKALGNAARERAKLEFQWEHQLEKLKPWM